MGCCLLWAEQLPPGPTPRLPRLSLPLVILPLCKGSPSSVWSLSLCGESSAPPPPHRIAKPSWMSLGQRQPRASTSACARENTARPTQP